MRLIDIKKFIEVREKLSIRISLVYSIPFGLLLFVLLMFSGDFFGGLLFGIVVAISLFTTIYLIRRLTHKGVENKRNKVEFDIWYFDVMYRGEMGALSIYDDKIKYTGLTPGGANKEFVIDINEDLFIDISEIKYSKFQSLKFGDIKQATIVLKPMPNGLVYKFYFYQIDELYKKVSEKLAEVDKFNIEKYK